uniref:F-box domain-containing protein n=1 Tax=Graphocephala atropunctata TaxID=36148 RepID=A0A1B6MUF1_9HEMI
MLLQACLAVLVSIHSCLNVEETPKFFLGSVEKNIMSLLKHVNLTGIASSLVYSVSTYNRFLTDILVQCKGENFGQLMVTKTLHDAGGPQILKHNFNYTYLKDTCRWSEIEILDFRNAISDTLVLWQNFKRYANVKGPKTKPH